MLVQKTENCLAFSTQDTVLIIYGLLYNQFRKRYFFNGCRTSYDVAHLGGVLVFAIHGNNGNDHTVSFALFYRIPPVPDHQVPGTLEIPDVIRVMHNPHLVCLVITDRKACFVIHHILLKRFKRLELSLIALYLGKRISLFLALDRYHFLRSMRGELLVGKFLAH